MAKSLASEEALEEGQKKSFIYSKKVEPLGDFVLSISEEHNLPG